MAKLRPVPWLILLQAGAIANEHWTENLSARERTRLRKLLQTSKGVPSNLSERERAELKKLVLKLDLPGAGRKLLPIGGKGRKQR
jgi:hypothetical protein